MNIILLFPPKTNLVSVDQLPFTLGLQQFQYGILQEDRDPAVSQVALLDRMTKQGWKVAMEHCQLTRLLRQ